MHDGLAVRRSRWVRGYPCSIPVLSQNATERTCLGRYLQRFQHMEVGILMGLQVLLPNPFELTCEPVHQLHRDIEGIWESIAKR